MNISDEQLDDLLREDAKALTAWIPGKRVDVTGAVMERVGKMPYMLPSHNTALLRRRRAVAAVAVMVILTTTGAGFGQYQTKVADEQLASMFSSVYDFHADYGSSSVYASESDLGYLF